MPMLYNGFYNKNADWIGSSVKEGVTSMEYKKDLFAGILVHDISDSELFKFAIKSSLENGAKGIVVFAARNLSDDQLKIIKEYK